MRTRCGLIGAMVLAALTGGCNQGPLFSTSIWAPFGNALKYGLNAEPVRIGLSYEAASLFDLGALGKASPWKPLVDDLSNELGRPVVVENLQPFQIEFHLNETGRLHFAMLGEEDYADITAEKPLGKVIAASEAGRRQGVIVVRKGSDIETLADLKGRRFAFGPRNDPVLHQAALEFLEDSGVSKSELRRLLPGRLQHHLNSHEVANEVAYVIGTEAGVIEADDFDAYPETGGRWLPLAATFSKDQFRVLGRTKPVHTVALAAGPVIAGTHADMELVEKTRAFLLSAHRDHPTVTKSLGFSRFRAPESAPVTEDRAVSRVGP